MSKDKNSIVDVIIEKLIEEIKKEELFKNYKDEDIENLKANLTDAIKLQSLLTTKDEDNQA